MNRKISNKNKQKDRRWILVFAALTVLGAVVFYLDSAQDSIDVSPVQKPPGLQVVSIETVAVGVETAEIRSYAEIRPQWSAELSATVSGRVNEVLADALIGERVVKGTALIRVEDSRYVADLVDAKLALKDAKLALRKAKISTAVARKEYVHTGAKPLNDLALRLPELEIAKRGVESAEAHVAVATMDLENTIISAPFSGFVTERFVSPGMSVNVGDHLLTLADDTMFELTAELGKKDWKLVKQPLNGLTAKVLNQEGVLIGQARIRQGGGFLDQKTRQYKVFLELKATTAQPVLAGGFAQIVLPGKTIPITLNVPASAITRNGFIWYVDNDNRLQRFVPKILFHQQSRVVIEAPTGTDSWHIAKTPLASFMPGQKIRIQKTEE